MFKICFGDKYLNTLMQCVNSGIGCHELLPNEIIPNVKIPNPKNGEKPFSPPPAKLGEGRKVFWGFYVRDYYVNPTK